jgi:hypothetical protein
MSDMSVHECQCAKCLGAEDHPDKKIHHRMNLLLSRLDEQQRRWYVAVEALKLGRGGIKLMSEITGLSVPAIRRGQAELDEELATRPTERVRLPGGGRKPAEKNRWVLKRP